MDTVRCDVLIVGASLGGVAAALRACRMGARVCLVEDGDWVGGQLTSQGVCTPDENTWVEVAGGTASYLDLRRRLREHYRTAARLSETALARPFLNVGGCWVSRLAAEPAVATRVLWDMLKDAMALGSGQPYGEVWLNTRVVTVEVADDAITAVTALPPSGDPVRFEAAYVLDATDLGELLPLAGAEHVVGAEAASDTGEPDAPPDAHPDWIQPFTFPFALELRPKGEDHTIACPPDYERMKALQGYHILDGAMRGMFGDLGWWTYRRVIAAGNFDDPAFACDVAMINTRSNDYQGAVVPTSTPELDAHTIASARRASLGYVYWLQTECPRADEPGRAGYPEMKLRADWFGTPDGIAPRPYIRESRRIRALRTVLEQEIVARDASGTAWQPGPRAAFFADSVGIGHYWLDIHQGPAPEPPRFLETRPFQIPLGALIPVRVRNLIAACKNLGVTHLTNGAYRLHPIEWNVGEAAGALAAFCLDHAIEPGAVHADPRLRRQLQRALTQCGVPLYWWTDLPADHTAFAAAQELAARGFWPGGAALEFRPDDPLTSREAAELAMNVPAGIAVPRAGLVRGDAARSLWSDIARGKDRP